MTGLANKPFYPPGSFGALAREQKRELASAGLIGSMSPADQPGVGVGTTTPPNAPKSVPRLTRDEAQATIEAQATRIAEDIGRIDHLEGRVADLVSVVEAREHHLSTANLTRDNYRDMLDEIRKVVSRGDQLHDDSIATADIAGTLRNDHDVILDKWTKAHNAAASKREADRKRRAKKKR